MTDSSSIQQARDVLARWRDSAFDGRWLHSIANRDDVQPGERVLQFDSFRDADARLIVGTAGNPDLLDAIDSLLNSYQRINERHRPPQVNGIAAAIIAADERMTL